jgi:hypothetical protein
MRDVTVKPFKDSVAPDTGSASTASTATTIVSATRMPPARLDAPRMPPARLDAPRITPRACLKNK